jgi:hypothetical protein
MEDRLDQKHAAGSLQELMSRASVLPSILSGVDRNHLPVQRTMGIFLADQLASLLACSSQATQPREPTPHTAVGHRRASFRQGMGLPVVIHEGPMPGSNRFPVGLVASKKVLRFVKHRLADELFVAQGEREGSR